MERSREEQIMIEMMLGMVYDKAREIYSDALIDHGMNTTHYGTLEDHDGYASVTGT